MYRVYHLGQKINSFTQRDSALDYIVTQVGAGRGDFGDYEILDNSDL